MNGTSQLPLRGTGFLKFEKMIMTKKKKQTEPKNESRVDPSKQELTPIIIALIILVFIVSACLFISYSMFKVMFTL